MKQPLEPAPRFDEVYKQGVANMEGAMQKPVDAMTEAELDFTLAELLPEMRAECPHCRGYKTDLYHRNPSLPCCLCKGKDRLRKDVHLEDLLVAMAAKGFETDDVAKPAKRRLEFDVWNWSVAPDDSPTDPETGRATVQYCAEGKTPLEAAKRAGVKALRGKSNDE